MNENIKEILDNVKKCCDIDKDASFVVYQKQDIVKLLNYITSLQEEYEEADYDRHKLFEENQKLVKVIEELENYLKVGIAMNYNMNNDKLSEQTVDNYTDILNKLTELKGGSDDVEN